MESSGLLLGLLCVSLMSFTCSEQAWSDDASAEDIAAKRTSSSERELVEVVEELLGKFHRDPSMDKRGSIPVCGMGQRCAVKLGPRIGTLCDCGRGSHCNSYLLKCI